MEPMMIAMMTAHKNGRAQSTAERELADAIANFEQTGGSRGRTAKRGFLKSLGF